MGSIRRICKGVMKRSVRPGTGPKLRPGQIVTVHCTGWDKSPFSFTYPIASYQKFWSTKDPGQSPVTFKIGQGSVIKGWDVGVQDMQVGEVALLELSPAFAYGAFGAPAWEVQRDSIVKFEIEVLEAKDDYSTKNQTTKTVNQSAVKRKKHNDERAQTPRRSKRQHNPLARVDSTIPAEAVSKVQPVIDVSSSASLNILAGVIETITQPPEGVAQESDPSKSLSHASGLTEASASSSPLGDDKGEPLKDINPENLAPNSHGTSPSKEVNEEKNSPEHFELKEQMDLLEMGNLDSEDLTLLDINVKDYSSTIFDDPMRVIDCFLRKVSSSSHSQLSAPEATVSGTADSLPAELLSEFRSVAFKDNILETLKQGQDPAFRLQAIKTKIKANKELFTQGQLDEVESTVKFLNEFLSAYKRLEALQDSEGSIQQDVATSSSKLQQTGVKLAHAKESKRNHQLELSSVESRIKELEDELRKLNTRKEALQSESLTQDAKIEADMKILEQLMHLILRDKARLFKVEKEAEDAKGVFDEQEKKYQALRNNVVCTLDGKDLKDQQQEIIDGDIEIIPE